MKQLSPRVSTVSGYSANITPQPMNGGYNPIVVESNYFDSYNRRMEYMAEEDGRREHTELGTTKMKDCSHYLRVTEVYDSYTHRWAQAPYNGLDPQHPEWNLLETQVPHWRWPVATLGPLAYATGNTSTYKLPELVIDKSGFLWVLKPASLDALRTDSLRIMLPGIRSNLSAVNSIIELEDFRTVPRTLRRIKSVGKSLYKFIRKGSNLPLRRLLGGLSDVYLQSQFNIVPLLSDIRGIQTTLDKTHESIKQLIHREGLLQRRHYRRSLADLFVASDVQLTATSNDDSDVFEGSCLRRRSVSYDEAMFYATLEYSYKLPQMSAQLAEIRAILDSLGINLNPAIIWNAIPWSFVVDWVADVSRWLDQFKYRAVEPVTYIHQYCCSTRVVRRINCYVANGIGGVHVDGRWYPASSVVETAYQRDTTIPDFVSSIKLSGLSLKEFSLAAALKFSRWH